MRQRHPEKVVPVCCVILMAATYALAQDWPQWRGPNRDGVCTETGLLQQWPQAGPPLLWKATGIGDGYSTVAVVGDRLYTTGEKDQTSYVHGLDRRDGKILWSTAIGQAGAPGWGGFSGPRGTPTVDGDLLFVMGQFGELICCRTDNGAEVWKRHLEKDLGGKRPEWGYSESVLVDGDRVVCTPGGSKGAIAALDKRTGEIVWQSKAFTDQAHYSSLVCAEICGIRQYIQLTAESVAAVGTDGTLLWRAARKGEVAVIPTPITSGNRVYVTSGYNIGSNCFEITRTGDRLEARQVYAEKSPANQHGGAIRVGDYVYGHCDAKGWVCQDLATGKLLWSEKGQIGKGSVVYADGRLVLRAEDKGTVGLIEANPQGYKEVGRFVQPDLGKLKTWPHPVIAGKRLYLRDQDVLLCYDVAVH